jgi:hypothetical protein
MQIQLLLSDYEDLPDPSTTEQHEHNLAWLKSALQAAISLEYATCPPYLSALWSIENDTHPVAVSLREVAQEEMVHLALACNMLSAIGGKPSFTTPPDDAPADLPLPARIAYPSHLPGGVRRELVVPLQGLGDDALDVFMEIESPEYPGDVVTNGDHDSYRTIGQFYDAIAEAFEKNADRLEMSTDNQITGPRANFVVKSIDDARRAIDLIQHQGEGAIAPVDLGDGVHLGTPTWEFAPGEDYLAHYYRYAEMKERRKITTWSEVRDGHEVTLYEFGEPIDWPTVFPMAKVPAGGYRADDVAPEVAFLLDRFDATYTRLLDFFEGAWQRGGQASFWHAIETMFDLEGTGRQLMQIPIPGTDTTYGPCFRYQG